MYGTLNFPHLEYQHFPVGARLGAVTVLPGGSNTHYVRSTGAADNDPPELAGRLHTTVNSALGQCRSGRGDTVVILEGHDESIATADAWSNLVAGTNIIGRGNIWGNAPTFTWTAAAGTILADVANVTITGCRFLMAGALASTTALTVTVGLPVTAAGFKFVGNYVNNGVDANQLTTDAITLSGGADQCTIASNHIEAYATAVIATAIKTSAAGADDLNIINNLISAEVTTAATGVLIDIDAGAILRNNIIGNRLFNQTASSKYVIDGHASSTGIIDGNLFLVGDGATGPASLGIVGCDAMRTGLNYCSTAVVASAILCPAADA
jgi:hypothetical protein